MHTFTCVAELIDLVIERSLRCLGTQLATQAGALDVPVWTDAGKVFANNHPEIPQGECDILHTLLFRLRSVIWTRYLAR